MLATKEEFIEYISGLKDVAASHGKTSFFCVASCLTPDDECVSVGTLPTDGTLDDALFTDLNAEHQKAALAWFDTHIAPIKSPNYRHSSYGLKHMLESDTGIYMTNNQFKHMMLMNRYRPADHNELNWHFCISEKKLLGKI